MMLMTMFVVYSGVDDDDNDDDKDDDNDDDVVTEMAAGSLTPCRKSSYWQHVRPQSCQKQCSLGILSQ
jgi:hypothetical protein